MHRCRAYLPVHCLITLLPIGAYVSTKSLPAMQSPSPRHFQGSRGLKNPSFNSNFIFAQALRSISREMAGSNAQLTEKVKSPENALMTRPTRISRVHTRPLPDASVRKIGGYAAATPSPAQRS